MGMKSAPALQKESATEAADPIIAATAKDPDVADNLSMQAQTRARKRGIAASYQRYGAGTKEKLGV